MCGKPRQVRRDIGAQRQFRDVVRAGILRAKWYRRCVPKVVKALAERVADSCKSRFVGPVCAKHQYYTITGPTWSRSSIVKRVDNNKWQ